jgi:hypothetical protein
MYKLEYLQLRNMIKLWKPLLSECETQKDINFPSSNDINTKIRKNPKRIKALCSTKKELLYLTWTFQIRAFTELKS